MCNESGVVPKPINRRASRRLTLRSNIKIECRKVSLGLGPNLTVAVTDLSETGVNLVLKTPMDKGQEVEVLVSIQGQGQFTKRLANVVRSVPLDDGTYAVGCDFQTNLGFADCQRVAQPPRIMQ